MLPALLTDLMDGAGICGMQHYLICPFRGRSERSFMCYLWRLTLLCRFMCSFGDSKGVDVVGAPLLPSSTLSPFQSMRWLSLALSVHLLVCLFVCLNYLLDIFCDSFRPWEICIILYCDDSSAPAGRGNNKWAYGAGVRPGHINYEHFCWPMNLIRVKANTLSKRLVRVCSPNRFCLVP